MEDKKDKLYLDKEKFLKFKQSFKNRSPSVIEQKREPAIVEYEREEEESKPEEKEVKVEVAVEEPKYEQGKVYKNLKGSVYEILAGKTARDLIKEKNKQKK